MYALDKEIPSMSVASSIKSKTDCSLHAHIIIRRKLEAVGNNINNESPTAG
jgi:hypothetical protein